MFASKEWTIDLLNKVFKKRESYSTDEQVIGTWIDGKPVYQKTLVGTTAGTGNTFGSNANYVELNIGVNTDNIINVEGYVISRSNNAVFYPFGNIVSQTEWVSFWCRNNLHSTKPNTVAIATGSTTGLLNASAYVTVTYTKATN